MSNKPNFKKEKPMTDNGGSPVKAVEVRILYTSDGKMQMQHPEDPIFTAKILGMALNLIITNKMQAKVEPLVKVANPLDVPASMMGRG